MAALLHFDGLTYVIESNPISKPADNAHKDDHDVYEQWVFDNKSTRHLLVRFISSNLVKQLEHFNTAKEIYDYAMNKYDETSKSHLMELGHFSSQGRKKRGESGQQGKVTKEHGDYVETLTESMMVDTNDKNRWIDSGDTLHISRTKVGFVELK
ncbi:hypothetical protein MRB53_028081 [Persea americana]|uniref:Uncharacterized protein n=1 Tax=Persea americana TaxID=3435 RepID=A0ACC2KEV1_PERAE|nr:hypothetical protein MRB53_028081 [Persea americana]